MPCLEWHAADQMPKVCFRVAETSHPICAADLKTPKLVRLPKASRIILRFDPLSQLETCDFIHIYAGAKKASAKLVWKAGRHEVARSGWPGVDAPALVIHEESFLISLERLFSSSLSDEETVYGYRIIAEAEMPKDAVASLQKHVSDVSADASAFVCASILSEAATLRWMIQTDSNVQKYSENDNSSIKTRLFDGETSIPFFVYFSQFWKFWTRLWALDCRSRTEKKMSKMPKMPKLQRVRLVATCKRPPSTTKSFTFGRNGKSLKAWVRPDLSINLAVKNVSNMLKQTTFGKSLRFPPISPKRGDRKIEWLMKIA